MQLRQKRPGSPLLRCAKYLFRRALLNDFAVFHKYHPGSDLAGERHFMGHDNHRLTRSGNRLNKLQHFTNFFRIQRGSRFIQQQNGGVNRQRPRNPDTLLLAAGETVRLAVFFMQ